MASSPPSPVVAASDAPLMARLNELRRGGRDGTYVEPSAAELVDFEGWIRSSVERAEAGEEPPAAAPAGFVLERRTEARGEVWLLAEQAGRARGAGAFLLRRGAAREVAIEAPHTFFDQGTLPIAVTAFEEMRARALFVNTVHRYASRRSREAQSEGDESDERGVNGETSASDVAHAPQSFFLTAHKVLCASATRAPAIQLHGFRDAFVPGASVVLSAAGTSAKIDQVATLARTVLGSSAVKVFPQDVRRLGGLTNVEARVSVDTGRAFVHAELSRSLRDRLGDAAAERSRFVRALVEALAPAPSDP